MGSGGIPSAVSTRLRDGLCRARKIGASRAMQGAEGISRTGAGSGGTERRGEEITERTRLFRLLGRVVAGH